MQLCNPGALSQSGDVLVLTEWEVGFFPDLVATIWRKAKFLVLHGIDPRFLDPGALAE